MRCRDHAHIHTAGVCAAQALEFVLLQNAQYLGLQLQRHIADLIQEQGATMGRLEAADRLRDSAGESTLFVSEEFSGPTLLYCLS